MTRHAKTKNKKNIVDNGLSNNVVIAGPNGLTPMEALEANRKKRGQMPAPQEIDLSKLALKPNAVVTPKVEIEAEPEADEKNTNALPLTAFPDKAAEYLLDRAIRVFYNDTTRPDPKTKDAVAGRVKQNKIELINHGINARGARDFVSYTQKLRVFNGELRHQPELCAELHESFSLDDADRYAIGGFAIDMINDENRNEIPDALICVDMLANSVAGQKDDKARALGALNDFIKNVKEIGGSAAFINPGMHNRAAERKAIATSYDELCRTYSHAYPDTTVAKTYRETVLKIG